MATKIMGWRPPQRPQWLKEFMKTPGYIKVQLSLLLILATSSVLSTSLSISRMGGNTSVENTFGRRENLEVEVDGLRVSLTGKSTTEVVQNLTEILVILDTVLLKDEYYPSIPQEEERIMKRRDNSSGVMFLQSP